MRSQIKDQKKLKREKHTLFRMTTTWTHSKCIKNEEPILCLIKNYEEDEVNTFETDPKSTYDEMLLIYEDLIDALNKHRKIVSTSNKTISTFDSKVGILNKEIEVLKKK